MKTPIWVEAGSLFLMSWFILLGAAVGVRESDHLGFEVGLIMSPPPMRAAPLYSFCPQQVGPRPCGSRAAAP